MTYSLIGRDEETGELGVAVQSRAFRAGAVCAWARAGVGAIATQSFTDERYGVRGLELLAAGRSPADALVELVAEDDRRDFRQVAFLAANGRQHLRDLSQLRQRSRIRAAVRNARAWMVSAGASPPPDDGNTLASAEVLPAMLDGFRAADGPLAHRLLDGLDAGEAAGGDFRGRQAGAVLVVSPDRSDDEPWTGRIVDVRVDDSVEPLRELRRLARLAEAHRRLGRPAPGASPDDEMEAARAAGMREDQITVSGAAAAAAAGDVERATAMLRSLTEADARWLETLDRYERLGFLPEGMTARLT